MGSDDHDIRRFDAKWKPSRSLFNGERCWLWNACIHRYGYGLFWYRGACVRAHRWLYEHRVGPIPEGMQIDHLCRRRNCVNPKHMEVVTPAENSRRSPVIGRAGGLSSRKHDLPEGVTHNGSRYQARIFMHGRMAHLGSFKSPEEASRSYKKARRAKRRLIATRPDPARSDAGGEEADQ